MLRTSRLLLALPIVLALPVPVDGQRPPGADPDRARQLLLQVEHEVAAVDDAWFREQTARVVSRVWVELDEPDEAARVIATRITDRTLALRWAMSAAGSGGTVERTVHVDPWLWVRLCEAPCDRDLLLGDAVAELLALGNRAGAVQAVDSIASPYARDEARMRIARHLTYGEPEHAAALTLLTLSEPADPRDPSPSDRQRDQALAFLVSLGGFDRAVDHVLALPSAGERAVALARLAAHVRADHPAHADSLERLAARHAELPLHREAVAEALESGRPRTIAARARNAIMTGPDGVERFYAETERHGTELDRAEALVAIGSHLQHGARRYTASDAARWLERLRRARGEEADHPHLARLHEVQAVFEANLDPAGFLARSAARPDTVHPVGLFWAFARLAATDPAAAAGHLRKIPPNRRDGARMRLVDGWLARGDVERGMEVADAIGDRLQRNMALKRVLEHVGRLRAVPEALAIYEALLADTDPALDYDLVRRGLAPALLERGAVAPLLLWAREQPIPTRRIRAFLLIAEAVSPNPSRPETMAIGND